MFTFPDKVTHSAPSLIRAVAEKGAKIPGFISFGMGNPAVETIPVEVFREATIEVFDSNPMGVLQYGPASGDASLAEWIRQRMVSAKGAPSDGYMPLELSGSGKGLSLTVRTLCNEGDRVFYDEFTYPNAFNCVKNAGCRAVGVAMDDQGMIPEALEQEAAKGRGRYIYLIPNFQNPKGITIPLQRRKDLLEVARRYDLFIYEDDPYGDIRFEGQAVPTMISLDPDGRVIYAGSFSKTLSAGIRSGYLYGAADVMKKFDMIKGADGQDPLFNHRIIRRVLEKIDFDRHIEEICTVYGRKFHLMQDCLRSVEDLGCTMTHPEGGMFLWLELPERTLSGREVSVDHISDAAIAHGIGIVKSEAFAVNPERTGTGRGFRLNFSSPTDEDITSGCRILTQVLKEELR